ncbi:hypothetical protein JCM8208_003638 [Rhodotorula glutinis]
MNEHRSCLLDIAGASRDLAGKLQTARSRGPVLEYAVGGPAAAASWILELPARDLSRKLATEIFVPTAHCRIRIMPLVPTADWGSSFTRPYFTVPRQVLGLSGGTTEIKVALNVTGLLAEAPAVANRSLSYYQKPWPPHAPIQTAPIIIYSAIILMMHTRDEQSSLRTTAAQVRDFESALMCEFLGLVIIVELADVHGAQALQGSLHSWRHFVRTLAVEMYEDARHWVAGGGLGGHFAHDVATWFVEHMVAPEEREFVVLLRAVEHAIRWVEMLFEVDHAGRVGQPAVEFRSLAKAAHSAFVPRARRLS